VSFEIQARVPFDGAAPSESFVGALPDFSDVMSGDIYTMLPKALRQLDADEGIYFLQRFLQRAGELWDRWQQKTWRIARLSNPRFAPDTVLDHLLALVGFGPGSGLPDRIARRLSNADKRKLAALAAQFWIRRGREDAISDAIRTLASGVRPVIDDWFWVRFLMDEALVGVEGGPGADAWLLYENTLGLAAGVVDGDAQVVFRVPDIDGALDRTLVQQLCDLVRPPSERYEIAFVDFVDTFLDGRAGVWTNLGLTPAVWVPGDSATTPITLPGLKLVVGAAERVDTPTSTAWARCHSSFLLSIPADNSCWVDFRFYVQPNGDCYSLEMSAPTSLRLTKIVGGVPVALTAKQVDLLGPSIRGVRVDTDINGGSTTMRVYLDGEHAFTYADVGFSSGTIEFRGVVGEGTIHRPEVFQKPLSVVNLTP